MHCIAALIWMRLLALLARFLESRRVIGCIAGANECE